MHYKSSQSLQGSFADDPHLSDRLFDLLAAVFPDIELRQLAAVARDLGASWESASTPFIKFEGERAIAHVGVLELPLCIMGQSIKAGGIHAVATHPDFRRRGHYRDCMEAALEYCDSRYETLLLTTSQPELYQPFGFQVIPESAFVLPCSMQGQQQGMRVLNLQDSGDRALLNRLLDTRIPVSNVVGVYPEKALFFVNEASRSLYYAPALDALIVMELENQHLHLFDVVMHQPLSLTQLLEQIPEPIEKVTFYFSPDRFNVQAEAIPQVLEEAHLMVRGAFAAVGQPLMLPRSARC